MRSWDKLHGGMLQLSASSPVCSLAAPLPVESGQRSGNRMTYWTLDTHMRLRRLIDDKQSATCRCRWNAEEADTYLRHLDAQRAVVACLNPKPSRTPAVMQVGR